jgi:hypothetical protein
MRIRIARGRSQRRTTSTALTDGIDVLAQRRECGAIRFGSGPDHDVRRAHDWKKPAPYELAQMSFQSIALHGGLLVTRHDESNAGMAKRGREHADVEMSGPDSLPLFDDCLYFASARQPKAPRKTETTLRVRRRRTYPEASP